MSSLSLTDWHSRFSQQASWTVELRRRWWKTLPQASVVLEVGCGTGAVAAESEATGHTVVGLDIDFARLQFAQHGTPRVRWTAGDGTRLPFPDSCFDAVYCHFLLLWTPRPDRILAEMARVIRPGGRVALFAEPDYSARIDYPPELEPAGRLQRESLARQGANPDIGRQAAGLFTAAGFLVEEAGILGGNWSPADSGAEGEWRLLANDLASGVSAPQLAEWRRIDAISRANGSRVLFVPTFYCLGRRGN